MSGLEVLTGRWTDYSYGSVVGERFTLSSSNALILVALISVFDGLMGNVVWNLVAFYLHQHRAVNQPRDGLYHQHQALLRNTPDALSFAQQAMHIGWTWRGRARKSTSRGAKLSLLAITVSVLFAMAGLLSSQIASSGEVLLHGPCRTFVLTTESTEVQTALDIWLSKLEKQSLAYAQSCYVASPLSPNAQPYSPLPDCNFYLRSFLNWTITRSAPCPFGNACSVPNSEIIVLDSGLLDSQEDMGINQPQENHVSFKRRNTCSPLTSTGFSNGTFYNVSQANGIQMTPELSIAATYAYGFNYATTWAMAFDYEHNYTFVYPEASYAAADVPYLLQVASTLKNYPNFTSFSPDRRIAQSANTPISLFFLANRVTYLDEPVQDPWFNATGILSTNPPNYYSTEPGNVLACLEQAQICNPNSPGGPKCTGLDDWSIWYMNYVAGNVEMLEEGLAAIELNEIQATTAINILTSLQATSFYMLATTLGASSFQAYDLLWSEWQLTSQSLPADQWQVEMNNWFGISLAFMQQSQLVQTTGPADPSILQFTHPILANDTANLSLCRSQKIRSAAYQSFSVLGIALNFVVGGVIVLVYLCTLFLLPMWQARRGGRDSALGAWTANGVLQLQRTAYENLELGGEWEGYENVPVTREDQSFRTPEVGAKRKEKQRDYVLPMPDMGVSGFGKVLELLSDESGKLLSDESKASSVGS